MFNIFLALLAAILTIPVEVKAQEDVVVHQASIQGLGTNPHKQVIAAVVRAGYQATSSSPLCEERTGLFGFVVEDDRAFVLCLDNITNLTNAMTTIRHEAIHVAQHCKGGLLEPSRSDYYISRAQDEGWDILAYSESQWDVEAEARVLANRYSAEEVVGLIDRYCF